MESGGRAIVNLRLADSELEIVKNADDAVILGVVVENGVVRLTLADRHSRQGHEDWICQEQVAGVTRAFSLVVRRGLVTAIHRGSRFNLNPSSLLEPGLVDQLQRRLPLAPSYTVLSY